MSYAKLAQIRIGIKCGGCARSFRHPLGQVWQSGQCLAKLPQLAMLWLSLPIQSCNFVGHPWRRSSRQMDP
jgi:hypothetical protein